MKELIVDRYNDETTLVNNTESSHTNASSLSLLLSKGEEEDARELQKSNEVSESDKVFLREHVLLTMGSVKLDAKVRQQLEEAVKDIVRMDFPEKWPVRLLFVRF